MTSTTTFVTIPLTPRWDELTDVQRIAVNLGINRVASGGCVTDDGDCVTLWPAPVRTSPILSWDHVTHANFYRWDDAQNHVDLGYLDADDDTFQIVDTFVTAGATLREARELLEAEGVVEEWTWQAQTW